jgi:hypothetical protein
MFAQVAAVFATAVDHGLEIAAQVRPTQLAAERVQPVVGHPAIRADNALLGGAQ